MVNYAIKRTTDGKFWNDLVEQFVSALSEECEYGTAEAVAQAWTWLTAEGHRVDIIRVFKGKAAT